MSNVNNKNTRVTYWRRSDVSIVNFEHILHFFLCFYCWLYTNKCQLGSQKINSFMTIYICYNLWKHQKNLCIFSAFKLLHRSSVETSTRAICTLKNITFLYLHRLYQNTKDHLKHDTYNSVSVICEKNKYFQ